MSDNLLSFRATLVAKDTDVADYHGYDFLVVVGCSGEL